MEHAREEKFFKEFSGEAMPENVNVLVIDDEEIMRNLLKDLLSDMNYDVMTVATGEEGILAFDNQSFDLVITDLRMPGIDGIKVLDEIRRRDPEAVIIVITGYGALQSAQEAIRKGAYDYITKPFELDEITFVIKRAIQTRRLMLSNKSLMKYLENQNIMLDSKVKVRTSHLEVLYEVGKQINSLDEDHILNSVVATLADKMQVRVCSILMYDKNEDSLSIKASCGIDAQVVSDLRVKPSEAVSGYVLSTGQAVLVHNSTQDLGTATEEVKLYEPDFISVPIKVKNEKVGVINLSKKVSGRKFSVEDFDLLKEVASLIGVGLDKVRLYRNLQELYLRVVASIVSAIDAKDSYTRSHSENVSRVGEKIARKMGLKDDEVERIRLAGQLHDVGKIGIRDSILTKPDKLDNEEWEEMKTHSEKAYEILAPLKFLKDIAQIVRHNHERYDGKGYPDGIKAEEIELGARIIAVADAYDTMTSKRPYRDKIMSKEELMAEFKRCSGSQFDPKVVESFLQMLKNDEI